MLELGRSGSDPYDIGPWVEKSSRKAARSYLNETRRRDGRYTVYQREIRRYDILNENVVVPVGMKNWRGHRGVGSSTGGCTETNYLVARLWSLVQVLRLFPASPFTDVIAADSKDDTERV